MAGTSMFSLGGALADWNATPQYYWNQGTGYLNQVAKDWKRTWGEQSELYNMAKEGILGNTDAAKANAETYNNYIRNLFGKQSDPFSTYTQTGDYLYGKLGDFTNTLKDAGLKDMNLRLAQQGITPGTTGYDRLLNATRITSNMLPAFNNTTNAIGRDTGMLLNDNYRNMLVRLGLAQNDALTQNIDRPYTRYLDLADERANQMSGRAGFLNSLMNAAKTNVSGYKVENDSDWSKAIGVVDNLLNGAVDLYASAYGGGMGGGQIGSNSPALGGQGGSTNGYNFNGGGGGGNNMAGIIQLIMGLMGNRGGGVSGSIPGASSYGGAYNGYGSLPYTGDANINPSVFGMA